MKYSVHVRCPHGKQCPDLFRKDAAWNSRHGSAGWAARLPTSTGTRLVKRFGYTSKAAAEAGARHVVELLDLAGADTATRARIGDLVAGTKRGAPLPTVADVKRRTGLGLDPGSPGDTVGEWLTTWLASRRKIRVSVERCYRQHIGTWLIPQLGHIQLERLTAAHIAGMFATIDRFNAEIIRQRAGGRALIQVDGDVRAQPRAVGPATQRRIFATLRAALNAAVKQRKIMFNPCQGVELDPENRTEARRWTAAEAAVFLQESASDVLGLMFRIAVLRGARRGELVGLRWAGADLDAGVLVVDHTILELDGHLVEGRPKTAAGVRRIYLDKDTAGLLKAHRKRQLAIRMRAGADWVDSDLIFCRSDGTPWRPSYVSRRFAALARQAGVPVIKLHEARHSAISLMADAGVDAELRMREVGHADRSVHTRYTHLMDDAHRAAAEQVATLVRKAGGVK